VDSISKLQVVLFILGIACFIYLISIISYAGTGTAFLWFWILIGTISLSLSLLLWYLDSRKIEIPLKFKAAFVTLFSIGILLFLIIEGIIISYGNSKPQENGDYLIVLGAQVKGTTPSRALKNRLDTAIKYLLQNENTKVIVSGGQGSGEDISEAEAMSQYLLEAGIDNLRIIKEDKSRNTYENLLFSKSLIKEPNPGIVIVTNDFHVFRALHIGKKLGLINVSGLPAPSDNLLFISYYVREFLAVIKDKMVGNI
jgi:uncharacterized SAM-binding protein YcdF (DUF218 family)